MKRQALILALLLTAACRYNPPGQCQSVAECQPGERCASGLCLTGCDTDLDCADWERCTGRNGDCVALSCSCSRQSDCENWEKCSSDHFCVVTGNRCATDSTCAEWEYCSEAGVCLLQAGRCLTSADCPGDWDACNPEKNCVSQSATAAGGVMIWGTLSEGASYRDALAPVHSPQRVKVGFRDYQRGDTAKISPSGAIYYIEDDSNPYKLRRFVPDTWKWVDDEGWHYPSDPYSNDPVFATPACDGSYGVSRFVMQAGTGKIIYSCMGKSGYYDSSSRLVTSHEISSWNSHDYMLASNGEFLIDPSGNVKTVKGLPFGAIAVRADGDGFRVAVSTSPNFSLWRIDKDGNATQAVVYGNSPGGSGGSCVLDAVGSLYCQSFSTTDTFDDVVLRYGSNGGPADIVYSESNAPENANDDRIKNRPLYVFFHISYLITSP